MEMGVTKQRSEPIYIEVSNKSSIATIGGVNMLKITICSFKLRDGPSPGFLESSLANETYVTLNISPAYFL